MDHRLQRVEVSVSAADGLRVCAFCPRALQEIVWGELGPPPERPGVIEMSAAISNALTGVHWKNPQEAYRKSAVSVIQKFARIHLGQAEVPAKAAEAMLDGKDWSASWESA
jgi:hypothetical protein